MPSLGRPTARITVTDDERATLQRWARRPSSAQALALRSRIVLASAEGRTDADVAAELKVHPVTVSKWRHRFAAERLEGLADAPRPGAARSIGDDVIEAVLVDTLESAPPDATHWSTRGLAKKYGINHDTVAEIWKAFGLKPWKQDSFKVSPDPDLVEKIRDLVGLYMSPPVAAAVFAVDEKPQIQALDRTAPTLPMLPTTPARATHDYVRNGTCDLFAALDMATGTVITDIRAKHTSEDFVAFLGLIDRNVPKDLDVHIILDNLSAHKAPKVKNWLLRHRRFHLPEVADVAGDERPADRPGHPSPGLGVHVGHHHLRPGAVEPGADGGTDPVAAAGHQGHRPPQLSRHGRPLAPRGRPRRPRTRRSPPTPA